MAKATTKNASGENEKTITIDGEKYSTADVNENARKALNTLQFAERKLVQLNGEIALANTARAGMINVLKNELKKIE